MSSIYGQPQMEAPATADSRQGGIREASSQAGRRLGRGRSAEGSEDSRRAPAAYPVESHLVDFFGRVALLPGAQFVAQLLGHLLHHVVPQLQVVHFYPRVLVVLSEFGQVEPQALAELVQDPEGAGEAGEGRVGHVCVWRGESVPLSGGLGTGTRLQQG